MKSETGKVRERGISRRTLIQGVTIGTALAVTAPLALVETAVAAPDQAKAKKEDPRIYKLLYLWLAVSTNRHFGPNGTLDLDTISTQTNISKSDLQTVIALNSSSTYKTIADAFDAIAGALKYTPSECPANFSTLTAISTLPQP